MTPIKYLILLDLTIYAVDFAGIMNPLCGSVDRSTAELLLELLGDFHKSPTMKFDALNCDIVEVKK